MQRAVALVVASRHRRARGEQLGHDGRVAAAHRGLERGAVGTADGLAVGTAPTTVRGPFSDRTAGRKGFGRRRSEEASVWPDTETRSVFFLTPDPEVEGSVAFPGGAPGRAESPKPTKTQTAQVPNGGAWPNMVGFESSESSELRV